MNKLRVHSDEEQREALLEDALTEADIGRSQLSPSIREGDSVDGEVPRVSVGTWYLLLLTCCLGGVQVIWTVILANGAPFLTSLGLSNSLTALVWIAAPLCGTVAQPLIGSLSDQSKSRFGRRRPFILGGSIGIVISVLILAWTPELVHAIIASLAGDAGNKYIQITSIALAVVWIYALNISIQFVQSGSRALIVEACPDHQQEQASAWANITAGGWNIFGYLCGFTNFPEVISTHLTQFQYLSLIASISMISTALVNCLCIHEPSAARRAGSAKEPSLGIVAVVGNLIRTYKRMPSKVRRVCHIQFWAWMGRFPFLFYSTTYVAEFYRDHITSTNLPLSSSSSSSTELQVLSPDAIRHGTFANFLFAIIAFVVSVSIPYLYSLFQKQNHALSSDSRSAPSGSRYTLARVWSISHFLWALLMFLTFFIDSPTAATILVASLGLSWAISQWVPFAIIGREIAASATTLEQQRRRRQVPAYGDDDNEEEQEEQQEEEEDEHHTNLSEATAPPSTTNTAAAEVEAAATAAAIMGIHNAAISAPQILAAGICSAVFALVRAIGWDNGTAWVMRVGGVAALAAGWLSWGSDL